MCANADIVIAAVGIPEMVKPDWIKEGAVVVDVGINRVDDPSRSAAGGLQVMFILMWLKKLGSFHGSGGVGPMTIAMLMENTVRAAELSVSQEEHS